MGAPREQSRRDMHVAYMPGFKGRPGRRVECFVWLSSNVSMLGMTLFGRHGEESCFSSDDACVEGGRELALEDLAMIARPKLTKCWEPWKQEEDERSNNGYMHSRAVYVYAIHTYFSTYLGRWVGKCNTVLCM